MAVWPGFLPRIGSESSSSVEDIARVLVVESTIAASRVAATPLSSFVVGVALPKKLLSGTPALSAGLFVKSLHKLGVVFGNPLPNNSGAVSLNSDVTSCELLALIYCIKWKEHHAPASEPCFTS